MRIKERGFQSSLRRHSALDRLLDMNFELPSPTKALATGVVCIGVTVAGIKAYDYLSTPEPIPPLPLPYGLPIKIVDGKPVLDSSPEVIGFQLVSDPTEPTAFNIALRSTASEQGKVVKMIHPSNKIYHGIRILGETYSVSPFANTSFTIGQMPPVEFYGKQYVGGEWILTTDTQGHPVTLEGLLAQGPQQFIVAKASNVLITSPS